MSKLTAAYLAGLIDGEGSIGFYNTGNHRIKEKSYGPYPSIRLRIGMTDKNIIEWLKESFGGYFDTRKYPNNSKYNDAYCWSIAGEKCEKVLRHIYPYLKIKKRQDRKSVV